MKEKTRELLFGKKNMTTREKIQAWIKWFILWIILMAAFKILFFS